MTLVERDGIARSFHIANVNAANLRGALVTNVDRRSHLMTDSFKGYVELGGEFTSHGVTSHSLGQYVDGAKHSNTAENFSSIFKRGVIGTYHHMSEAHLGRYCAEFDLRYNTRNMSDGERAAIILKGGEAVALPIGGLISSPPKLAKLSRKIGQNTKRYFD